jgi:flagellar biosynthesis protein FlhG
MPDQAEKLRRMVAEDASPATLAAPAPPMIAVTGGKGGVGATTVAMNLAAALADRQRRVVLVDAARHHADLAELAGVHLCRGGTLSDVLAGKSSAADVLVPGPAGALLLADRWGAKSHSDFSSSAQQRLLDELDSLGELADIVIVDTGSGVSQWSQRFWQHAHRIIVPTTCDDVAVMDAYATIKLGSTSIQADVRLLVNQSASDRQTAEVERRLATACQRFLGRTVSALPSLPLHAARDDRSFERKPPRIWELPSSPFGHAVLWLASAIIQLIDQQGTRAPCAAAGSEPQQPASYAAAAFRE